jgi:hypothetical protein
MFKKTEPKQIERTPGIIFPHCDQRILHAPNECEYCDKHSNWQYLRQARGIAFTGYEPEEKELPCPADYARGDTHKLWRGNIARPVHNHLGGTNVPGCPACEEQS